jgi:hypothetical protein
MKLYETHYEEYLHSLQKFNLHPELTDTVASLPQKLEQMNHLIVYGATGVGKYTQTLNIIQRFSPTHLKYDKKIQFQTEKLDYHYRISDIHYEVDMSLLGCNSKQLWHEIFFQIVDIVSVKPDRSGIIVCKNFHAIYNELLDVFYSYMQHVKTYHSNIVLKFILVTEHVSFLPNNIINNCQIISVKRPTIQQYTEMQQSNCESGTTLTWGALNTDAFAKQITGKRKYLKQDLEAKDVIIKNIDATGIINAKELYSFSLISSPKDIPKDIFNIVCDNIVWEIMNHRTLKYADFRYSLYDILIYNLDVSECVWYVLYHFICEKYLTKTDMPALMHKTYTFLKYYNNNYRPIYHLENMFYTILINVHQYP